MRIYLNLSGWNRPFDDFHIVLACFGNADYFVTTDGEIIKKRGCIERYLGEKGYKLKVVNPLGLWGEIR